MSLPIRTRDSVMEQVLRDRAEEVEPFIEGDLISYLGPIDDEVGVFALKSVLEGMKEHKPRLILNLETMGGYVESAERMALIMRHHYQNVDFVITTYAMSAGTVLVMSGDRIWMDYSATLGPIDPQRKMPDGSWLPALGYLKQYERLVEKSQLGTITDVEADYLIEWFDPALLYLYEQARDLSVTLIEEWLVEYKFKNWRVTETQGTTVTDELRKERAAHVARLLNDTERWHSHNRGIPRDTIERDLRLRIEDLDSEDETTAGLRDALTQYNQALFDYRAVRGHDTFVIDSPVGYFGA